MPPILRFYPLNNRIIGRINRLYSDMSATATCNVITLRGSTDIVTEFFNYSVNNILYQRGVYPPESFKRVSQYGLSMMITTDEGLLAYLSNILRQLDGSILASIFSFMISIVLLF